jgi:hypothetical protein
VIGALALAGDAPELVIAHAVATVARPDGQRPELVKAEAAIREMAGHVLDPVQLGVLVRVGGFLPGPGALEADPTLIQNPPQPLPADPDRPAPAC